MTSAQVTGLLIWGGVAFLGLIILIGMGSAFSLWETLRSRSWIETPCTIKLSQMDRKTSGKMYWNVVYAYKFEGQEYSSKRFEILEFDSAHWSPIADLVDQFPPGRASVCYVNPSDPETAILSKRVRRFVWTTSVPIALICIGVAGMLMQLPRPDKPIPVEPAEQVDPVDVEDDEPKKGSFRYSAPPSPRYPAPTSSPSPQTVRHT
jgi:hypothetical protein